MPSRLPTDRTRLLSDMMDGGQVDGGQARLPTDRIRLLSDTMDGGQVDGGHIL